MQAVDSNILFDVLSPDAEYYEESVQRLEQAAEQGPLAVCDVVYAELGSRFARQLDLDRFLEETDLIVVPSSRAALYQASVAWKRYTSRQPDGLACAECGALNRVSCSKCGAGLQARQHMIADFIVGGHAMIDCGGLITRDQRYFRSYREVDRLRPGTRRR